MTIANPSGGDYRKMKELGRSGEAGPGARGLGDQDQRTVSKQKKTVLQGDVTNFTGIQPIFR